MFKISVSQQANVMSTSDTAQRSSLKISIKSICNKSLSKKLHTLAEKCRRFSQELKEHTASKKQIVEQATTTVRESSLTKSDSELGSSRSLLTSDVLSSSSSHEDLTAVNLEDNDSVFVTIESSSELIVKQDGSIPPAPPLPGNIPPAPPLPSAGNIPTAPGLPKQKATTESVAQTSDNRSKLMEEIRQGVKLRATPKSSSTEKSASDPHSKLMKELINHGAQLKKVSTSDIPVPPPLPAAFASKPTDGRSALLSEIAGFSKDRLRKAGSSETVNVSQPVAESSMPEAYDLLLSDEMFNLSPKLSEAELNTLADSLADYLFKAADIDWMQVIAEQTKGSTQATSLKSQLEQAPEYVKAFCDEILKFPDCYKSADVASPESPKAGPSSVIDVALKRLQAGRNRLFSTIDAKGTNELKKGEAILESAINAARSVMTAEQKSALLSSNVKSATFKVFSELPCMEGFAEQNGKAAFNALRLAFYSSIQSGDTAQQDIARYMKENLAMGFSGYSYLGLTSRVAQLEAQLAALTTK
uniref:VopF n=1 Tax=Vibrio cholerae TaxID=666 RepID=A0A068BCY9_VIBCL|nr:VopF [Vibrio cholerae]AIC83959.1 VopF [Vibrio cholerae]